MENRYPKKKKKILRKKKKKSRYLCVNVSLQFQPDL